MGRCSPDGAVRPGSDLDGDRMLFGLVGPPRPRTALGLPGQRHLGLPGPWAPRHRRRRCEHRRDHLPSAAHAITFDTAAASQAGKRLASCAPSARADPRWANWPLVSASRSRRTQHFRRRSPVFGSLPFRRAAAPPTLLLHDVCGSAQANGEVGGKMPIGMTMFRRPQATPAGDDLLKRAIHGRRCSRHLAGGPG